MTNTFFKLAIFRTLHFEHPNVLFSILLWTTKSRIQSPNEQRPESLSFWLVCSNALSLHLKLLAGIRQIIRCRVTAILRRPKLDQDTCKNENVILLMLSLTFYRLLFKFCILVATVHCVPNEASFDLLYDALGWSFFYLDGYTILKIGYEPYAHFGYWTLISDP